MILTSSGYSIAIDHVVTYWGYGPLKFVSLAKQSRTYCRKGNYKNSMSTNNFYLSFITSKQSRILINKLMHFLTIATLLQNKQNFQTTTIKKI